MLNKILFCTGEGIGNVIQTIPVVRTLKDVLGYDIDYWYAFGRYNIPKIMPYVNNWIIGNKIRSVNTLDYNGKVSTFWTRNYLNIPPLNELKLLNEIKPLSLNRSEVDTYMDIARNLGASEKDLLWCGECNYTNLKKEKHIYDIVVHNGYKKDPNFDWSVKSYPYYEELVKLLNKFKICSVGAKEEYIEGTDNKTGLDLLTTFGIIKNSKLFIGNDSGLYHAANALGVDNIVIFTATSIDKNYDRRFHKYSTLIYRDDLKCRPCQNGHGWKKCKTWECRNIDPKLIKNIIEEKIDGK
jgi:ADP-heptose:LPS heptosyltransferase